MCTSKKALLSIVQSASAMLIVSRLSFMGDVGVFKVKSANAKTHLASLVGDNYTRFCPLSTLAQISKLF